MGFFDLFNINRFAKFFTKDRFDQDIQDKQELANSQGMSQEELDLGRPLNDSGNYDSYYGYAGYHAGMTTINIQFEQYFVSKAHRISKYREMSYYPDISDALDIIVDDGIIESTDGDIIELEIKDELPEHIEEEIRKDWRYLLDDVFNYNEVAWDLFRKWMVDGELYIELILNSQGTDILGIKVLPAHTMTPIYENGKIIGYVQSVKPADLVSTDQKDSQGHLEGKDNIIFDKDQIVYINHGNTGKNKYDVRGFLEPSVRIYNQLKHLEDAVVIYRIVRAPERRVWNVQVGRMPKAKAEEYIRGLMQRYRKRIKYDSSTGAMDSAQNVQAMVEDFWFAKNADGEGTTVETLGAGQNLGEMEDVKYFQKKLYKNLKLPSTRWNDTEGGQIYSTGKSGEITREEIKFANFISRLQKRFKYIVLDAFLVLLRMRGFDNRYIDHSLYNIKYSESNLYKQYKELELLEARFALLGSIDAYIYKPEENPNGYFSSEYVLRNWFMMTDDEYLNNKALKEKEKLAADSEISKAGLDTEESPEAGEGGFGRGAGAGGGFGAEETGEEEVGAEEEFGAGEEEAGEEEVGAEEAPEESVRFNFNGKKSTIINEFISEDKKLIDSKKKNRKNK